MSPFWVTTCVVFAWIGFAMIVYAAIASVVMPLSDAEKRALARGEKEGKA